MVTLLSPNIEPQIKRNEKLILSNFIPLYLVLSYDEIVNTLSSYKVIFYSDLILSHIIFLRDAKMCFCILMQNVPVSGPLILLEDLLEQFNDVPRIYIFLKFLVIPKKQRDSEAETGKANRGKALLLGHEFIISSIPWIEGMTVKLV